MKASNETEQHWDEKYRRRDVSAPSWFQPEPAMSLELLRDLRVPESTRIVDVGGGMSSFADRLVELGFSDVTVLDLSEVALEGGRGSSARGSRVRWLHEDVLSWDPERTYGLWHDRALFHFLVEQSLRERYLTTLRSALRDGGFVIVATFAEDGPELCSGLPVSRYSAESLARGLGQDFTLETFRRELHITPTGTVQPFTWIAGRITPR